MMDPQRIIEQHKRELSLDECSILPLGAGENHKNYVVSDAARKVVVRINLRPSEDDRLLREQRILARVPPGLGPRVLVAGDGYLILSFVEGEPVREWDEESLKKVARALAALHRLTALPQTCRLIEQFDAWYAEQPLKPYPRLHERVRAGIIEADIQSGACLVHADTCCDNILISDKARLIDWESAHTGDPAEDIARLYYPGHSLPPWFCALSERQLDGLVREYQSHRDDPTLAARVRVWNRALMFLDMHYFAHALRDPDPAKACRYQEGLRILEEIFRQGFGEEALRP